MIRELLEEAIKNIIINEYEKTLITRIKYNYKIKKEDHYKLYLLVSKLRLYKMLRRI